MGRKKRQQQAADQKEKLETMSDAAGAFSAYRPHQQEAYNEGLAQTMEQFQGTNNMLAAMGGGNVGAVAGAGPEGGLVSPAMMGVGATSKAPGYAEGTPGLAPPTPESPVAIIEGQPVPDLGDTRTHEQKFPTNGGQGR